MKRKILATALAGIAGLGAVAYFAGWISATAPVAKPGKIAVLRQADAPTKIDWQARASALAGNFADPFGVVIDSAGNVLVSDDSGIQRLTPDGQASIVAAGFDTPSAMALDRRGNLYVADTGHHAIKKITPAGVVTTLAGNGKPGYADGIGAAAQFNGPVGVAVDKAGNVFVTDTYNDRIRRIAPDGTVTTVAGNGAPGDADGAVHSAGFDTPSGITVAPDGTLYIADTGNDAVRTVTPAGLVTTLAAPAEGERRPILKRPVGIVRTHDGYLYVSASSGGRILQFSPDGTYRALENADARGDDRALRLYGPRGIAVEPDGSLVVADANAARVQRLAPPATSAPAPQAVIAQAPIKGPMPWPIAPQFGIHEVVGLMGEVRGSYDGESRDHFHGGLDVRADVGDEVLAVAASKVTDPYANWGFGTLTEGFSLGTISYVHMRVGRTPSGRSLDPRFILLLGAKGKPERVRVPRGTRFAVGDALGTVNAMAHVHLDYYPGGPATNPMTLPFVGLIDTIPPQINSIALYDNVSGRRLVKKEGGRLLVPRANGDVSIVADAWDQMDGNLARRRLGLYKLGYQLLHEDGTPLPGFDKPLITQTYDQLPREREAVKLVYAASSGIPAYGARATHFAYTINNTLTNGVAAPGSWKVADLAPGNYILRVYAADYSGLVATNGRDLAFVLE
ncbi:MAG: gluconolaconase [Pseudomonadota bacterium]|nr:gluconolaconase [Pseudomonadota bacterium]